MVTLREKLNRTDLEAYFEIPPFVPIPINKKLILQDIWKSGFEIANKIFEIVGGCQCCGNCCKGSEPVEVGPSEIKRIANYLNKRVEETFNEYCIWFDDGTWDRIYLKSPCPFLNKNNKCDIYPARPFMCKSFPIRPTDFLFTIVNYPDCQLSQNIYRYLNEFINLPEIKTQDAKQRPEIKKFFVEAFQDEFIERKLPSDSETTLVPHQFMGLKRLEDFADWLDKRVKR